MRTIRSAERIAVDAMLLAAALLLSYIEAVIPLGAVIPVPGAKLGLANIAAVMLVMGGRSSDAAVVQAARIIINGILFGNLTSFMFSATGGMASVAAIILVYRFASDKLSAVGLSVIGAVIHNIAQMAAAYFVMGIGVMYYLPVMLICATASGIVTGLLALLIQRYLPLYPRTAEAVESFGGSGE